MFVSRYARATAAGAAMFALAVVLGGCQSGSASDAAGAQRQNAASAAARAASASKGGAKPAAMPPTTPCVTADLAVTPAQRHVTEGVQVERFSLATANPAGCTLSGPPHLVPKGPLSTQVPGASVDLALSQQDFPDDLDIRPPQSTTVPLTPGKSVSFYLAWFSASPVVCVQSNGFAYNAPDDTAYTDMRPMKYAIGPICDGIFYVSAVF